MCIVCKHINFIIFAAKSNNNLSIWSELAMTLLTIVAEGASLGAFLAKFHLSENTVNSLVNLDNKLKPAWMNLMVRFWIKLFNDSCNVKNRFPPLKFNFVNSSADNGYWNHRIKLLITMIDMNYHIIVLVSSNKSLHKWIIATIFRNLLEVRKYLLRKSMM